MRWRNAAEESKLIMKLTGPANVGMVPYVGIPYAEVGTSLYVMGATREEIVADVIRQVRTGQVSIFCLSPCCAC